MKFIFLLLIIQFTFAESIDDFNFNSSQDEKRYRQLVAEIRCPVCQGQSIGGSNAGLARDLRIKTKEMIEAHKTNQEIKDFMVARYGDFVSFTPPMKSNTLLLWFSPFILLLIVLIWFLKDRKKEISYNNVNISEVEELLK